MPEVVIKTWLLDWGLAWDTIAEQGIFKLQYNSSPVITRYSYRIVRKRDLLPNLIEAYAFGRDEAKELWQKFTGLALP